MTHLPWEGNHSPSETVETLPVPNTNTIMILLPVASIASKTICCPIIHLFHLIPLFFCKIFLASTDFLTTPMVP